MKTDLEALRTSWTLVARLKNLDDEKNWEEFYRMYCALIVGVARKAGLREDEAQDVLQETMKSISMNIKDFEAHPEQGSFRGWLMKTARWRIQDQLRKRLPVSEGSRRASGDTSTTPTIERVPNTAEPDLESLCDAEWRERLMSRALQELQLEVKAAHYQILHHLMVERMSVEEVATLVGCSRAQVYLVKHRMVSRLKHIVACLERRFK